MKLYEDEVLVGVDEWVDYYPTEASTHRDGRFYSLNELIPNPGTRPGPVKKYTKEEIAALESVMKKNGRL